MIKVCGHYVWAEGARFDADYYHAEHMRLTRALLQPLGLRRLESDQTLLASPPQVGQIIATSNAYFDTLADAQAAMAQAGPALLADLANYSSLTPRILLCRVSEQLS